MHDTAVILFPLIVLVQQFAKCRASFANRIESLDASPSNIKVPLFQIVHPFRFEAKTCEKFDYLQNSPSNC